MVRPILVKMNKTAAREPDAVDRIQSVESSTFHEAVERAPPDSNVKTAGNRQMNIAQPMSSNTAATLPQTKKVTRILEIDDDPARPLSVGNSQAEIIKSYADVVQPDIQSLEVRRPTIPSNQNNVVEQLSPSPKTINSIADHGQKMASSLQKENEILIMKTKEQNAREMAKLREYAKNYDIGPRIVSDSVVPTRDGNNSMMQDIGVGTVRNNYVPSMEVCQTPRISLIPNVNEMGVRGMNQWNTSEINPVVLNAYMKSMDQVMRQNQAILQHDRTMMINQALKQQQALNRNVHGANMNRIPNHVIPSHFMENGLRYDPGFQPYAQTLPSKEDLNKNGLSAMDYISKIGKNKRGRPKRNPAEGWPKRPLSAYNIFFKECREKIVGIENDAKNAKNPGSSTEGDSTDQKPYQRRKRRKKHGKISFGGLAKSVGSMWKELSPESMAYYEKKAEESREAYRKEIKLFLEKRNKTYAEKNDEGDNEKA